MTISELRLALDLGFDSKVEILKQHAKQMSDGNYLFVDSADGSCYLFDKDCNEDDINKLTYIKDWLFVDDFSLKTIRIPNNVTRIGKNAFSYCRNLINVTIPDSVTSIGKWEFFRCDGLTGVTIPNSMTSIGEWTFSYCTKLTSVTIPDSVTRIAYEAFNWCTNLKELIFKGKTPYEVKTMAYYPWGIKDESVIKCES